jgi:hypothetical protein
MDVTYNLGNSNCVRLLLYKFARLDNREDCLQFAREVELVVTNLRQKSRRREFSTFTTTSPPLQPVAGFGGGKGLSGGGEEKGKKERKKKKGGRFPERCEPVSPDSV